jgi:hypothetical protein
MKPQMKIVEECLGAKDYLDLASEKIHNVELA